MEVKRLIPSNAVPIRTFTAACRGQVSLYARNVTDNDYIETIANC